MADKFGHRGVFDPLGGNVAESRAGVVVDDKGIGVDGVGSRSVDDDGGGRDKRGSGVDSGD